MARIPDKFANPRAQLRGDPGANVDTGAEQIGRAVQGLGASANTALLAIREKQIAAQEKIKRAREAADMARREAEAVREYSKHQQDLDDRARREREFEPQAPEDIQEAPTNTATEFGGLADGTVQRLTGDIEDEAHRERVIARLTRLRTPYEARIAATQLAQETALSKQAAKNATREFVAQIFRDPTTFRDMAAAGLETIKNPDTRHTPAERMEAVSAFQRAAVKAAILGEIERSPAAAQAILKRGHLLDDGGFDLTKFLTVDDLRQLGAAAEKKAGEVNFLERYTVGEMVKADIASRAETGQGMPELSEERIAAAAGGGDKGAVAVAKYREQRDLAEAAFRTGEALADARPEEAARIIENLRPKPGSANFDLEQKLFVSAATNWLKIDKERSEDAAGYVERTFDPARRAAQAAGNDPVAIGVSAGINMAHQIEIGIPPGKRRVLSNARRDAIVADIENAPAADRAAWIENLRLTYGANFNRAMTELVGGKLNAQTQILTALIGNRPAAQAMAKAIETGSKDLVKAMPGGFSAKEFRGKISETLRPFMTAVEFGAVGGSRIRQINAQVDAVTTLAMQYVAQGDSEDAAVKKAAEAVVLNQYDVKGSYYVPRTIGAERIVTEKVHAVLQARQSEDAIRAFRPFPLGIEMRVPDAIDVEDLREQTITAAADPDRAKWATTADGTGAFLLVQGLAGGWFPLINENGDRYEIGFIDANNAPIVPRAPETERLRTGQTKAIREEQKRREQEFEDIRRRAR